MAELDVTKNVKQIASIAIILLGVLLIFGNLSGNLGFASDTADTAVQELTLSETAVTFTGTVGKTNPVVSSVVLINATGGETILAGNYTLTDTTIVVLTATYNNTEVNASYTTTYDSQGDIDAEEVISDVTTGVTSLSDKFSTVFTILGVLLIVGAVVWLLRMFGFGRKGDGNMFSN